MAGWTQRWRIDSRDKLQRVLRGLMAMPVGQPLELVVRTERVEKTAEQRRLFHAICADLGERLGFTPKDTKLRVKADFYGVEVVNHDDGVVVWLVPSSEESDREEYSRLIDHAYAYAAKAGVVIPDQRQR